MGLTEKSFLERNEEMGIFKTDCKAKSNQSADLISRKAAIKEIESIRYCGDFISALIHLPAVDAAPVVHGKWITNKYGETVCSECDNNALQVLTGCLVNMHFEPHKSKFCPNCGAKMDCE